MKKYSPTHEWVERKGDVATVGISTQAAKEIGEIVFVQLPKIGQKVRAGEEAVVVESTKAAIDICSPVSGEVVAVNDTLRKEVQRINNASESDGWLYQIRLTDPQEFERL